MPLDQETLLRHLLADRAKLIGYIRAIVRDRHIAEDVFQDVSILAVKKRDQIGSIDAAPGWLRRTARFEALNAMRKRQRDHLVFDVGTLDLLDGEWSRHDATRGSAMVDALDSCMGELSDYAQRILRLRYRENLTGSRLASAAGKPMNTVYVAMSRAHSALAECVRRKTGNAGGEA